MSMGKPKKEYKDFTPEEDAILSVAMKPMLELENKGYSTEIVRQVYRGECSIVDVPDDIRDAAACILAVKIALYGKYDPEAEIYTIPESYNGGFGTISIPETENDDEGDV